MGERGGISGYRTDLSLPDDFLDGLADHVAMELQVHVVQHVGSAEQHRSRVGHVLTDALLEGVPRALPTGEVRGQVTGQTASDRILAYRSAIYRVIHKNVFPRKSFKLRWLKSELYGPTSIRKPMRCSITHVKIKVINILHK